MSSSILNVGVLLSEHEIGENERSAACLTVRIARAISEIPSQTFPVEIPEGSSGIMVGMKSEEFGKIRSRIELRRTRSAGALG